MKSKTDEKSNLPTPGNIGNTSLHSIAQRWLVMLSGKGSDPYKKIGHCKMSNEQDSFQDVEVPSISFCHQSESPIALQQKKPL